MLRMLPKWQLLKTIGGSRAVALAGFFPFVGYLIVANDQIAQFLVLITDSPSGHLQMQDVTLRLQKIYFGMLFLSIGVILYKVFCPAEVSDFKDRYEFLEKEMAIATPLRIKGIQGRMGSVAWYDRQLMTPKMLAEATEAAGVEFDDAEIKGIAYVTSPSGATMKSLPAYQAAIGIPLAQVLNSYFDFQNTSNVAIRMIALLAFGIGYLKLAIPSLSVAWALLTE